MSEVRIRFPNENHETKVSNFDIKSFDVKAKYDTLVFGWYVNTYISVIREDYDKLLKKTQ